MMPAALRRLLRVFERLRPGTAVSRLVRQMARKHWLLLVLQIASFLLLVVAETLTFYVIFRLVRSLAGSQVGTIAGMPAFFALLLMVGGLQVMVGCLRYVYAFSLATFSARCEVFVASVVHRYVLSLSYPSASGFRVGELSHLAAVAPRSLQQYILLRGELIVDYLLILTYAIILLSLSFKLSFFILLLIACVAMILRTVRPRVRAANRQLARLHQEISADITEDIRALRLLHSNGSLGVAQQRLDQRLDLVAVGLQRLNRLRPLMEPLMDVLPVVVGLLIAALAWWLLGSEGDVLFPNLVTMVLLLQRTNFRINRVVSQLMRLDTDAGNIRQLELLLDPADKDFRRRGGAPVGPLRHQIRFEAVSLRYAGRDNLALEAIDLELPVGRSLAIVGESGSGKSTLADLLAGLYEPTQGRLLIDGVDLREIDLDSWQRQLGIVSQDVIMLSGTVRENITFGLGPVDDGRLWQACEAAGASEFITALPGGLEHVIGEAGHRLSGGQRQRLALARAFLRDPAVLVLDEATSALDSRSEQHVLQALAAARTGRTLLTIAHRLSSVRDADEIVVMQRGRIVERGRHQALLNHGGVYAELWSKQNRPVASAATSEP